MLPAEDARMPDTPTPPRPSRSGQRVPSGPRPPPGPLHGSPGSSLPGSRTTSSSGSLPKAGSSIGITARHMPSLASLAALPERTGTQPSAFFDERHDLTVSPEQSPPPPEFGDAYRPGRPSAAELKGPQPGERRMDRPGSPPNNASRSKSLLTLHSPRPSTPTSFIVNRPGTPGTPPVGSPRMKPKPPRLVTNLAPPDTGSPTRPLSPSLKHWQQVRSHVLATPAAEKATQQLKGKKQGLVSKAAGRFGFRNAAEHVMGYDDRRRLMTALLGSVGDLSAEEREEIGRERRMFARDIKACLDACALEESRRRLTRGSAVDAPGRIESSSQSVHASQHTAQKFAFNPDFSAFAPLLTELHRHLPFARAKKAWSRTCPHHGAILAELSVAFLPDSASTDGERQQALEVFGAVVKFWAADNAEEELDRWLFLCRALRIDDRQLRDRGFTLLASCLHNDTALAAGPEISHSALAFQALAAALIELQSSLETAFYDATDHLRFVSTLLSDLADGRLVEIDPAAVEQMCGSRVEAFSGGLAKELLWMAVARDTFASTAMASWLLRDKGKVISRFTPAPVLHATPPAVLYLRSTSSAYLLSSLSTLVQSADSTLLSDIWSIVHAVVPQLDLFPDPEHHLPTHLGRLLVEFEMRSHAGDARNDELDPFRISSPEVTRAHWQVLVTRLQNEVWRKGIEDAVKSKVYTGSLGAVTSLLRSFLENKSTASLGKECMPSFFQRLVTFPPPTQAVRPFLTYLASSVPQLFYKPLFALTASTQPATLAAHLQVVSTLSDLLDPARYWTHADAQMVVIVLMGDATPKGSKGKGKEGERSVISVKLGRYSAVIELIRALDLVEEPAASGTRLRAWVESVEARLATMLQAEERESGLPRWYRALLCTLFLRLRAITSSIRKSPWQRFVLSWFFDKLDSATSLAAEDAAIATALSSIYESQAEMKVSDDQVTPPPAKRKTLERQTTSMPAKLDSRTEELLAASFANIAPALLVAVHACLALDDWAVLTRKLWNTVGHEMSNVKATTFLLMKCGELVPVQLRSVIVEDLQSTSPLVRARTLRKLAILYGHRFQVLAQKVLTDRRGPVFQWSSKTLEFVPSEIGSPVWVAQQDVQDAALQKFGNTLPLELRQRLLELGWSEDPSIAGKDDVELVPVTSLPSLQMQESASETAPSSRKTLMRRASSGSGVSLSGKRRKAILAPVLAGLNGEQALLMLNELDGGVAAVSLELVRLFQRDDPSMLLRPLMEQFSTAFPAALARLNAVAISATPGFAYTSLNALVGYLKLVLRSTTNIPHHAAALSTISMLVPHVSGMSLRDIRKNKAESVLLPASIHEEEGGYRIHAPWRDGSVDIQTAQLVILNEMLKMNPREAYLIKKMLSNLQIKGSISDLAFSRAWLLLIGTLFSSTNRNYNDRAELRHFLANIGAILQHHGRTDTLICAHAMRIYMLCGARFRRLFASMGFSTIMRPVYETYSSGNTAIRDCIEYAARSFYRIHSDIFVYQACVVIADGPSDPAAVYDFLASLSIGNTALSGVPSGVNGLNDREEIDALVQMLAGPELALSELGKDRAERQSAKLASLDVDAKTFPRENIVKLFVTVIAANPSTKRAANFLRLFAGLVPQIKDAPSQALLQEGVEALGDLIANRKTGDEAAMLAFHPDGEEGASDWLGARREYVFLVESFAKAGGKLGPNATKTTLEIVLDLLRKQPEAVGPAAASIVRELAKTHLANPKANVFLRDIAPLFRAFITVVDFSGLLDSITGLIHRSKHELSLEVTVLVVDSYLEPAVRFLASASDDGMAFSVPMRSSLVRLLAAAVFLRGGDAFGTVESCPPSAGLLASLVLPLFLVVEQPSDTDRDAVYDALWIRLLHYVLRPTRRTRSRKVAVTITPKATAATSVLTLQLIKVVVFRAPSAVSAVKGLWSYIASHLLDSLNDADGRFAEAVPSQPAPRVVDWMMWSFFELLCLHPSPLMIHLRLRIQTSLLALHQAAQRSRPSSPGEKPRATMSVSPQLLGGRARMLSVRSPSISFHSRHPSSTSPELFSHARVPSGGGSGMITPEHTGHTRLPSVSHLSPEHLGHSRIPSSGSHLSPSFGHSRTASGGGVPRPSFADLSARRASRPVFDAFPNPSLSPSPSPGMRFRFPSSAPVRSLATTNEKGTGGGAIIHLLGAPSQVLSATSSAFPTLAPPRPSLADEAVREVRIGSDELVRGARRAVRVCMSVFGLQAEEQEESGEEEEPVRVWSVHEALHVISEQTRTFAELEFRDVFNPRLAGANRDKVVGGEKIDKALETAYRLNQFVAADEQDKGIKHDEGYHGSNELDEKDELEELRLEVPTLAISSP